MIEPYPIEVGYRDEGSVFVVVVVVVVVVIVN